MNILKLLKALNSNQKPWQINLALVLGMYLGFLPFFSFFSILIIFFAFVLNINLSVFFLMSAFFSGIAFILDPIFHKVGLAILTFEPLIPIWEKLYNTPYMRLTDFNNTVVIGALIVSTLLAFPIYKASNFLVLNYRKYLAPFVEKYKILKILKIFQLAKDKI